MILLTTYCVAMISFLIASSDKLKSSEASLASCDAGFFNTDVETSFGGKEINRLGALEKNISTR